MEPNLLIGDRLFVSKYSYGYSQHSFPFSPKIFTGRILKKTPKRGDVVVFKTPADNRTDYIKRLIGLPGDKVQIINKDLYLNGIKIEKKQVETSLNINCGGEILKVDVYEETLPNGTKYLAVYRKDATMINSDEFIVPNEHYFFLGDNRDCSKDSRFLSSVGYVNFNNLVGKARIIFFSTNKKKGSFFKFWNWNQIVRKDRLFKKIKCFKIYINFKNLKKLGLKMKHC